MDVVVIPKDSEPFGKEIKDGNCSGFSYQTDGFVVFNEIKKDLHEFLCFVFEELKCPYEYDGYGFSIEKKDYESYAKFYMAFSILRWAKIKPKRIKKLEELYLQYKHMDLIFLCWIILKQEGDNGYYFFMTHETSPFSVMELRDTKTDRKNPYSSMGLASTKGYGFCPLAKCFSYSKDIEGLWELGMSLMADKNPFKVGDKVKIKEKLTKCPYEKAFVVEKINGTNIQSKNGYSYPCGAYEIE